MKAIGNILWFLFGGAETALIWLIGGILCCITVVGLKYGLVCFRLARLGLWPMGKVINTDFHSHPVLNTVWVILGGELLALLYLIVGFLWCATLLGVPFGLQAFKYSELACFPFGSIVY